MVNSTQFALLITFSLAVINVYGSQQTLTRINKEYMSMQRRPPPGTTAGPIDVSNMYKWRATITGPEGSPYEDGVFPLNINFPANYPFSAPSVTFACRMYHVNIQESGNICLDILQDKWSPALTIPRLLLSISSLLTDPNPDSPYNRDACNVYRSDRARYDQTVREYVRNYAQRRV